MLIDDFREPSNPRMGDCTVNEGDCWKIFGFRPIQQLIPQAVKNLLPDVAAKEYVLDQISSIFDLCAFYF